MKVGVTRAQMRHIVTIVKDIEKGMLVLQVKDPARFEEMRDDLRPSPKIGEPTQHTARSEYDVERILQCLGQFVKVRTEKAGVKPRFPTQSLCQRNRVLREIHPGDASA